MHAAMESAGSRSADPRVELYSTRGSRVASHGATKIPGGENSHTTRYSAIRKRAYRRARRRAEQNGGTYYRGKWMSASALGTHSSAAKQQDGPPKRWLKRWLDAAASPKSTARLRVRCYNMGGVNAPVYDHLHFWLTTTCTDDIVILQELHWGCGRTKATWTVPGWSLVISADPLQRYAGVGVAISHRVADSDHISFKSCLPGRLLHARCVTADKTLDVIAGYQWVRSDSGVAATTDKRTQFWTSLGTLLHHIPLRNLVVVGADFNTQCRPLPGLIGRGTLRTTHQPDRELEALLTEHQLVLLNTWGKSHKAVCHTYRFDTVCSQIDFIAMRRHTADRIARLARPVSFDLAPWRAGAKHRAVLASIPWRAGWTFRPRSSSQPGFSLPQFRSSFRSWDPKAQELYTLVRQTLEHAPPDATLQQLNAKMLSHCERLFPGVRQTARKPSNQPEVVRRVQAMRQAHAALQHHQRNRGLSGLITAWRLYTVFQRQSRALRQASRTAWIQWFEEHIQEAEHAAQRSDIGAVYRVINKLAPRRRYEKVRIRSASGAMLGPKEEFNEILQHFRAAFDGPVAEGPAGQTRLLFESTELGQAISCLKRGKAVPKTSVPAEIWQLCPEAYADRLACILNATGEQSRLLPQEVVDCTLSLLPKPHKTSKRPADLRPLGLQDPSSKIVAMAVRERLQSIVQEFVMSKPLYAYITGKSIDGAIARVVQHCAHVREQMKHAVPTVHDRRSRKKVKACCGGAMLSLDLSRAFDEVPRESLSAALAHAQVPPELRDLIIALHVQCVYKVTHKGQTGVFPMRKGVRQGCALSPLLFTLFTCHIYDVLASRTSHTWAQQAITLFADDSHFTWIINHMDDLRFLVRSVRATFQTFREFGMQLNMDKSRFVVKLQGGAAKRWLKARTLCSDKGPVMQFGTPHSLILIPRVHSMVYLGIIASYTGFESQTFEHRRQAALGCKHRLGRGLRSKRLQLRQRARLYVACVRSSLLYGMTAVGVTGHVVRKLDQFDSRALHSLARSPAFLSHESSEALRKRLNVSSPSHVLHQALERRVAKSSDAQELQWFTAKLQEVQDVLALASSSSNLRSADVQEGVACPDCGIYFPSFRIMRSHRARSHKQHALKVQVGVLAAQDYVAGGVDGMPTCRWCRRIFTRVEDLKKHLRKGCPQCMTDVETSQKTREPGWSAYPQVRSLGCAGGCWGIRAGPPRPPLQTW